MNCFNRHWKKLSKTLLLSLMLSTGAASCGQAADSDLIWIQHYGSKSYIFPADNNPPSVRIMLKGGHFWSGFGAMIFRPVPMDDQWGQLWSTNGLCLGPTDKFFQTQSSFRGVSARVTMEPGEKPIIFTDQCNTPATYWRLDGQNRGIQHRSGTWIHPYGGYVDGIPPILVTYPAAPGPENPQAIFDLIDQNGNPVTNAWLHRNHAKVSAGVTIGRWALTCQGAATCSSEISSSVNVTNSTEKTLTTEEVNSFAVSVTAGVDYGAASGELSVSKSHETSNAKAVATARGKEVGTQYSCGISQNRYDVKGNELDVFAVWQMEYTTQIGAKSVITRTCMITCSPDGIRPTYEPGSPNDLAACIKLKG